MTLRIYGSLALQNQAAVQLFDAANGYSVQLRAPASLSTDTTFALPPSLGQNNQVMVTDANGQFSFAYLSNESIAENAAISLSKLASVTVSRALVSDASGVLTASGILSSELDSLSGVTGNVQSQIDSEASSRAAADAQEAQDRAAADSQEADARAAGDLAEKNAREAADAGLSQDISDEADARAAAVSQEAQARSDGDSQEATARQNADSALSGRLDVLEADPVTKSYVDTWGADEATTRAAGDANLQSQIDNLTSNLDPAALDSLTEIVSAFQAADSDLTAAINSLSTTANSAIGQEETRAKAAEAALQTAIDSEVTARQNAVSSEADARSAADSQEAQARQDADVALGSRIDQEISDREDAVSAEAQARSDADSQEATARQTADTALGVRIDGVQSDLSDEATARAAADSQEAQDRAAAVAQEKSEREAADSQEAQARVDGDAAVQANLDAEVTARTTAVSEEATARAAAVSQEKSDREAADAGLQIQIDNLSSGSSAALDAEIQARQDADSALSGRLDVVEGVGEGSIKKAVADLVASAPAVLDTLKELADALGSDANFATTVAGQIGAEAQARQDADSSLHGEIVAEQSRATGVEAGLQTAIDSEASARAQADSDEANARQNADTQEATARAQADQDEANARQAADSALSGRLDVLEGEDTVTGSVKKAEKDAKAYADTLVNSHKATMDWMGGTSVTLTHNWGTKDVIVQVYDSSSGQTILTDVSRDQNSVTCSSNSPASMWRVIAFNLGPIPSTGGSGGGGGGGGGSATLSIMSHMPDNGNYTFYWNATNASGKYVQLQAFQNGVWAAQGVIAPASMGFGTIPMYLSYGDTVRLILAEDSDGYVQVSPEVVSGSVTLTSPSGGGGGGVTETLYLSQTAGYFDGSQTSNPRYTRGISFLGNGEFLTKITAKLKYNYGSGTVKFLLRDAVSGTPLAETSAVDITTIAPGQTVDFTFAMPVTIASGVRYYAEIFLTGGEVGMEWEQGPQGNYGINYFWYDTQGGASEVAGTWTSAVYTSPSL